MLEIAPGWNVEMDRGPNWLIVRFHAPAENGAADVDLRQQLWALMQRHLTNRLVVELDALPRIDEGMIHQLAQLQEQIEDAHGQLRVCGVTGDSEHALRNAGTRRPISVFRDRGEAVMGFRPAHPR